MHEILMCSHDITGVVLRGGGMRVCVWFDLDFEMRKTCLLGSDVEEFPCVIRVFVTQREFVLLEDMRERMEKALAPYRSPNRLPEHLHTLEAFSQFCLTTAYGLLVHADVLRVEVREEALGIGAIALANDMCTCHR